jgi:DNA modification methylase
MTSPPYFTMEIYDDNPETNAKQSIVKMYEREGDGGSGGDRKGDGGGRGKGDGGDSGERLWYNNYLKVWINKCYDALRKGGVIALNINQYKNQHYIYWLLDDMKSSKWTYLGIISHSKPDKKNPQPTFIWRKGG